MQTTFLNAAGTVLFTRDDMEQGNWTQEEYTVNATFPFVAGKVIERGQRLSFRDPATGSLEMFEVRNVTNIEPEHYQQIIAEHIAVSELSDEHINNQEITDKTPAQALTTVLTGTLWAVGNVSVTNASSVDIARGSVWQAVGAVAQNWNVYIVPRVTVNAAGAITGRYLDVTESTGVWRGLRLSIDKNMADASVVYDDSETLTALYGYGGSVNNSQTSGDDTQAEVTFAGEVWTATSEHPAKPAGQTYLEDPQATALYGRNGRPRFGYYQNGYIKDGATLLAKTWEALKQTNKPKISISGTVADLYRLGYKDQPIRLHDLAIVDIPETGELFYLQIIRCYVDLIDPTATRPEIGAYIPNIIYINRETNDITTSGTTGGGGGGGRGQKNTEYKESETYSAIEKTDNMIGLVVGTRNGNNYIKAGEIGLAINKSGESGSYESTAYINANHVNISATNTVHTLAGDLEHDAQGQLVIKNAGGMYVQRTESGITTKYGVFDNGNLTGGVVVEKINGQTGTITRVKGNLIVVGNDQTIDPDYREKTLDGTLTQITSDFTTVNTLLAKKIEADYINATNITAALANASVSNIASLAAGDILINSFSLKGALQNVYVSGTSGGQIELTLVPVEGSNRTITFSKAATLQATYGGSNQGTQATYTVTGSPAGNFPSGATVTGTFTIHINSAAAWVTDPNGTIRARIANPSDTDAAYKSGWNDCIDAATKVDRYTRSATGGGGAYGGNNYAHYISYQGQYKNVGTGWYKTSYDNSAYHLPSKKT